MIRSLSLLFLLPLAVLAADYPTVGSVERLVPEKLDALIAPDARIEKLCEGFTWSEGPVWKSGALLFSDVPENIIHQWKPGTNKAVEFLKPSGMTQPVAGFREQGSNGLALDRDGHLIICQHGDRRVARFLGDGKFVTIADRYQGKRFNSPNDLAIRRSGEIYFTDPPYGLDKLNESPLKELSFNGVFRVNTKGEVHLVTDEISFPNGIAFAPDEKTLYVANSHDGHLRAYDVQPDGSVKNGRMFFDAKPLRGDSRKGSCDGLKVDAQGNVWATGPGGVLILDPAGKHLGSILTGQATANCGWGDDGTLYMTADMFVCRIQTKAKPAH